MSNENDVAVNDMLVLICGDSASGKSASLENLEKPEGVMYLNCESGKKLPFKSTFDEYVITDPYQVYEAFTVAESMPDCHTIVIDGLNYLMDMFESVHVIGSSNTMAQWSAYGQFFRNLMQQHIAKSTKNVLCLAHVTKTFVEDNGGYFDTAVPIKGAMKGKVESFFSTVVYAKRIPLRKLEDYQNDMLIIDEDDEDVGIKYCFQTRCTKETIDEKMRGPRRLWKKNESFINNDAQVLLNHLNNFYK